MAEEKSGLKLLDRELWSKIFVAGVPTALILFAFSFYLFGYCFLYGVYFGTLNFQVNLIQIVTNPIPFDYRSTVIAGFVITSLVVLNVAAIYSFIYNKETVVFRWFIYLVSVMVVFFIIGSITQQGSGGLLKVMPSFLALELAIFFVISLTKAILSSNEFYSLF